MTPPRIVWRVRCKVTDTWKICDDDGTPKDFDDRDAAMFAARYLKRWRLVKVTIRRRLTHEQAHREIMSMSAKGMTDSAIRSGILDKNGRLTKPYRS